MIILPISKEKKSNFQTTQGSFFCESSLVGRLEMTKKLRNGGIKASFSIDHAKLDGDKNAVQKREAPIKNIIRKGTV
jgi:hypothetical protein